MATITQRGFSELLATDLYEFVMLQAYAKARMTEVAVFEFFVRALPEERRFLMAAGLQQAIDFLQTARLTRRDVDILAASTSLDPEFLATLEDFRFTGDVDAVPEGTVFFANEPILRVAAPIAEAQVVESRVINLLHFQTVIASKAARMVLAAEGRPLIDFGLRRAHGLEAGLLAARASFIAGFTGSATVPASLYGIPVFGTMAHSFIQAHDDETQAFLNFAAGTTDLVLLVDTYDTAAGVRHVVDIAPRLRGMGINLRAVRIDSGDLASEARVSRGILDAGGLRDVKIIASGGLDETELRRLVAEHAPIDSFGVGTSLTTSRDAPALDCAYKLQEYAGRPRRKRSPGKATLPGRKQIYRRMGSDGRLAGDVIGLVDEDVAGDPMLQPVMRNGKRVAPPPSTHQMREHAAAQLDRLPDHLRALAPGAPFEATLSPGLVDLVARMDRDRC